MVWALPRPLAATEGISFDFFSCRYLDGSVPCVSLPKAYVFSSGMTAILAAGLPHSAILGSTDVCSSPRLFAAYHGLHRRIAPRHPLWTLTRLTILLLILRFAVKERPLSLEGEA